MPWRRMRDWRYGSTRHNPSCRWRFTLLPRYPPETSSLYPLDVRLGEFPDVLLKRKISYPYRESKPTPWPSSPKPVTILAEISRLTAEMLDVLACVDLVSFSSVERCLNCICSGKLNCKQDVFWDQFTQGCPERGLHEPLVKFLRISQSGSWKKKD
jgi:hypothetical protein